jgi:hypothetical protein
MLKHIYDKTDKGREEIATRKYHVPSKLRALLVMMDGQRPLEALMKNFAALGLSQESVTELLKDGLIILVHNGEPEPAASEAAKHAAQTARARQVARREASARGHHEHDGEAGDEALAGPATAQPAAPEYTAAERHMALQEFYTQTIKSTLGLRGMMLQLKVEKCSGLEDFRALRDAYVEAVLKAKGREMALSLSRRLDQLLGIETDATTN